MTTQTRTNARDEHPAVLDAVPAIALDSPVGTGPIAIFYGAARYPFELARQRELVEDYADAMGLNLVTEFHDRQQRQYGLGMLLDACQRGGVAYVITAGWPTPNLTTAEADAVVDQLTQAGTHLVCLNTWQPGDGEPPAWWNDEEGAWMRQLDELREQERQQREQTSEHSKPGETGADSQVNQAGKAVDGTDARETSKAGDASVTSTTSQANEQHEEVHHA
ncbi:hypothetical protein [Actinomyces oris]|mgnify:CR=1 FL=1|uniref:hypothetical protein n=2 Tax=Actinomyces TaxID=1654 RepID=UPI000B05DCF6|nr:hypothetical protein [Actinomyces oris]